MVTSDKLPIKIALTAIEPSGAKLSYALIGSLKNEAQKRNQLVSFFGVGDHATEQEGGFRSLFEPKRLIAIGIIEVLGKLKEARKRLDEMTQAFESAAVVLAVDAPVLHLPLLARLKGKKPICILVVSPTFWSYFPKRKWAVKKKTDIVFCLFPFEAPLYQKIGHQAFYIGHPLATSLPMVSEFTPSKAREILGLEEKPTYGIFLGSRASEIKRHLPFLKQLVFELLRNENHQVLIQTTNEETQKRILSLGLPENRVYVLNQDAKICLLASDVLLLKSGTITLQAALLKRAMVVFYVIEPLMMLMSYLHYKGAPGTRIHSLPNIIWRFSFQKINHLRLKTIKDYPIADEFIGRPKQILKGLSDAAILLMKQPKKREKQIHKFLSIHELLKQQKEDPGKIILDALEQKKLQKN